MSENLFFFAQVSDNKDPDGLNRIKVVYQSQNESVTAWIPYLTSLAGEETGFSVLPDIDEQVLVVSIDSHRSKMVALGSIWSEVAAPPVTEENADADLNQDGNNSLDFIKTKAGNMLIFDDTQDKEKIQIINKSTNSRIEFISEDKKLSISTDEDIDVSSQKDFLLNAENINFEAEKEFNVSCENFQVKTNKEINMKSDNDMILDGSGISLN